MALDSLRQRSSAWAERVAPTGVREVVQRAVYSGARRLPSFGHLTSLMSRYTVDHLVNTERREFEACLRGFLAMRDATVEGYRDPAHQRDLSIQFHWGHDHDFGSFALKGRMGDRHLRLMATFIDQLGALPLDLSGKRVLDVGCWTGGTSLLLCAMGAQVVAVEEVKKYVDCLLYLKQAFDISTLEPKNVSLYDCIGPDFDDGFDFVLFAGVLYHVTDPILALRITFDALTDGGRCLVETACHPARGHVLGYEGPRRFLGGNADDQNRVGWNWLLPSRSSLRKMMEDVGFTDVKVRRAPVRRAFAAARRARHVDMLRAGLSLRSIR